jgi:glycosyltransferase involved in cell wall biosynthesis
MNRPTTIAYIFERYPALSQTFLRREITGLAAHGLRIEIHAMLPGGDANAGATPAGVAVNRFSWWAAIQFLVALPRECFRDPALLRDGWRLYRRHRPLNRENLWATLWAVIFAFCHAQKIRRCPPDVLHGVRATGPATAAAVLSRICRIPFTFGAHAYDIYRHGGDAFLEPKLRAARFVHTTTDAASAYLRQRCNGAQVQIVLARRGLETLPPRPVLGAPTSSPAQLHLLSVGRLVAKKGHAQQIAACALLKEWNIPFQAKMVGAGALRAELEHTIEQAGLRDSITLCGPMPPEEVQQEYGWADIFWHTGMVDADGDRDGLPNVIPEAFAYCLPVITTNLPGATEAVTHEKTGLVVNANDAAGLAAAVKRLVENAALRRQLGENGRRWVEENFLISRNAEILARAFEKITRPSA